MYNKARDKNFVRSLMKSIKLSKASTKMGPDKVLSNGCLHFFLELDTPKGGDSISAEAVLISVSSDRGCRPSKNKEPRECRGCYMETAP